MSNFSAGIMGVGLTLLSYTVVGMAVEGLTLALAAGAKRITQAGLLPLIALIIEPGKVLFINNALNHGVLGPLGIAEANQVGKSIFFLLETNPGRDSVCSPPIGCSAKGQPSTQRRAR